MLYVGRPKCVFGRVLTLGIAWVVKNLGLDGEKTSFGQNSKAGRDLDFAGPDLLEFLGF